MAASLLCAWGLLVAVPLAPRPPSKEAPVAYRCDKLRMVRARNEGICDGNVVVRQRDLLLCCTTLTGKANADGAWQSFTCEGDVRGAQGDLLVWAGRATFDAKTDTLVLTRSPRSKRGGSTLWGRRMVISTADGALDVDTPRGHLFPQSPGAPPAEPLPPLVGKNGALPASCPVPAGPSERAPDVK